MDSYYVRIQGRVLGPLARNKLVAMKNNGQLHKFHEVSTDKIDWRPATAFTELYPELAPAAVELENSAPFPSVHEAPFRPTRSAWPAILTTIALTTVLAGAGVGVFLWQNQKQALADKNGANDDNVDGPAAVITGHDEKDLGKAVGMVACGLEVTGPSGERWVECICTGTCFAISPEGHFLTNRHVIEEIVKVKRAPLLKKMLRENSLEVVPKVWVFLRKTKHEAQIIHVDEDFDFGIIQVDKKNLHAPRYFCLDAGEKFARETKVTACGFPGGARAPLSVEELAVEIRKTTADGREKLIERFFKARDFEFSLTSGVISRMVKEEGGRTWIEHSATIIPGNSGGPLIDESGNVLAINTQEGPKGSNIYRSLALRQLKPEIQKVVKQSTWK